MKRNHWTNRQIALYTFQAYNTWYSKQASYLLTLRSFDENFLVKLAAALTLAKWGISPETKTLETIQKAAENAVYLESLQ